RGGHVGVCEFKDIRRGCCALDEQLDRRKRERARSRKTGRVGWNTERQQTMDALTPSAQRLSAGCQDINASGATENPFCSSSGGIDHVLATINNEQKFLVAQEGN